MSDHATYKHMREWPFDLLDDLYGEPDRAYDNLPEDFAGSLAYVIESLSEREKTCILERYRDHDSLAAIGQRHKVTTERIRQVVGKAVRKLRHPSRMRIIEYGVHGYLARQTAEAAEKAGRRAAFKAVEDYKLGRALNPGDAEAVEREKLYSVRIEDLNLSVRSFHCLKRQCVNTVGDLLTMTAEELERVRNLGVKSHDEIVTALERLGCNCLHLRRKERKTSGF
ncbi:MAG: hypothetical protein IKK34_06985 [Clostridia bacterium]|nr:hypothetical protein [Clostridia bacterium]